MSFSRFVAWTGTSGAWSDSANWYEEAPGQMADAAPPTASDVADVFLFQDAWCLIAGGTAAAAGQLYLNGFLALDGQVAVGDAYVGQPSGNVGLVVEAGSTLTAHDLSADAASGTGEVIADGAGALITVATTLELGSEGGGLAALNGGTIQAAGISAALPHQILVDATGAIEFGSAGDAAAGRVTVDEGVTAANLGYVQAPVTVNGTITAVSDWTTFAAAVAGSGVIGGFADFLGPVAAGPTLALELSPVSATLEAGVAFGAVITGLDQGDILQIDGAAFTTAAFTPGAGDGTLVLGGSETLALGGDFSGRRFVLAPGLGATQVSTIAQPVAPAEASPAGSGAPGQTFTWAAFNSGAGLWASPANWIESGVGTASIAPGVNDTVWLTGAITGNGNAALAYGVGPAVLSGNFAFGSLVVEVALLGFSNASGPVDIGAGAVVAAGTAEDSDALVVEGGGRLAVSGTLTVVGSYGDAGLLAVYGGGVVTAAELELDGTGDVMLAPDGILEVGGGGLAQAGTVMVDAGATLGGSGTVDAPVSNAGTVVAGSGGLLLEGGVSGGGVIEIAASGTLAVAGLVGEAVGFSGAAGTLDLRAGGAVVGAISGFAPGDAILAPAGVTGMSFAAGTLRLIGATGTSLGLDGNFSGDSFFLVPLDGGDAVVLAAGSLQTGTPPPPPVGTTVGNSFVWTAQAGDWGDAANWSDLTTGADPATIAPGSLDSVSISTTTDGPALLRGGGDAALLTVGGTAALSGTFDAAAVDVAGGGLLAIAQGSTLVAGGTVQVGGGLAVLDGGTMLAEALVMDDGSVSVAPNGLLQVGGGGSAVRGAMVVDAGATASIGAGTLAAALVDNGVLSVSGTAVLAGAVSGAGQVVVSTGATLTLGAGAGIVVMFGGDDASVGLDPASFAGVVGGFTWSDALDLTGEFDAAVLTAGSPGSSRLTLWQDGTAAASVSLLGDYGGLYAEVAPVTQVSLRPGPVTATEIRLYVDETPAACFAAGTRIATVDGEAAVETLRVGELVRLANGGVAPIVWLGHRDPRPGDAGPVRIRKGAFGEGRPRRDLVLSPDHAVLADGVLVPVRYLVNDATVVREMACAVTYWHVELARHGLLLAEGLAAESYLDTGNRGAFDVREPVSARAGSG